jgi:hypothetical protein
VRISVFFTLSVVLCGAIVIVAGGVDRLVAADQPRTERLATAIAAVRAVGHEGTGDEAASSGWRQLGRTDASHLIEILAGMDGAGPLATNYLRAAVDTVAERTLSKGAQLPADQLERFVLDRRHSPRPRRLAYEWLVKVDPSTPERLLPGMLDDPSLELRRDAVAKVLAAADHAEVAATQRLYQVALDAARDLDQIQAAAEALAKLGVTTNLATHLGYIVDWHLIGPFDNTDQKGFQVPYPPEAKVDFDAVYDGKSGPVRWQRYHTDDPNGIVDLNKALAKHKGAIVYAAAAFVADKDQTAELRLGCINASKVWLNGELASTYETYHTSMVPDQYVSTVRLKRGTNMILVKICQNEQEESWAQRWEFQLRVTDRLGTAVDNDAEPASVPGAGQ